MLVCSFYSFDCFYRIKHADVVENTMYDKIVELTNKLWPYNVVSSGELTGMFRAFHEWSSMIQTYIITANCSLVSEIKCELLSLDESELNLLNYKTDHRNFFLIVWRNDRTEAVHTLNNVLCSSKRWRVATNKHTCSPILIFGSANFLMLIYLALNIPASLTHGELERFPEIQVRKQNKGRRNMIRCKESC